VTGCFLCRTDSKRPPEVERCEMTVLYTHSNSPPCGAVSANVFQPSRRNSRPGELEVRNERSCGVEKSNSGLLSKRNQNMIDPIEATRGIPSISGNLQ
jgi:hypothetical protein